MNWMEPEKNDVAEKVFKNIVKYRRRLNHSQECSQQEEEQKVREIHLPLITSYVNNNNKIIFVLPAFPVKSPNQEKVIGKLPDMAEKLSLKFLNTLCEEINSYYKPGAEIIICSDGHVFADLINVSDQNVNNYQQHLDIMIDNIGAKNLRTYNLSMVSFFNSEKNNYDGLRRELINGFSQPENEIKNKLLYNESGLELYRSITRFLFEDSYSADYHGSKAALQKNAKSRACGVIQRSWAWGNLLCKIFPDAIRLSIHPQSVHSRKLGIHMLSTKDDWLTPWHGVSIKVNGRFVLMKRKQAEQIATQLIYDDGKPSYFIANN